MCILNSETGSMGVSSLSAIRNELHAPEEIFNLDLDALTIHTCYRGHPDLSQADHQRLFRHELVSALRSGGVCTSVTCRNRTVAACAIRPLDWDTAHFGLPMARLTLAASPFCPAASLPGLLRDTISALRRKMPVRHISCEVDIDDYPCLNALLDLGANVLDVKREYRWTSFRGITPPKFLSRVRDYDVADRHEVMGLMEGARFEGRFSRDPLLSPSKTLELYRIWLEKLLDGNEADRIALVIERNGRVQGCGTIERQDLRYAGVNLQLMSGGIYVSSPTATGGYYPMIYSLVKKASALCRTSQTCVSLNNHAATRVLEKMNLGTTSTRYALRLIV